MPSRERIQRSLSKVGNANKRKLTDFYGFSNGGDATSVSQESITNRSTSDEVSSQNDQPPKKKRNHGHKTGFDTEWQTDRPWLKFRVVTKEECDIDAMFCSLCEEFGTHSSNKTWVETGCRTIRLDKVKNHQTSEQHKSSLALSLSKKMPAAAEEISSAAKESMNDALKVMRFIINKNLPLDLFKDLTDLCIDVGSGTLANLRLVKNATYSSWDVVDDLLKSLSNQVKTTVVEEVKQSESFATMVDEVCDKTTEKHLAICLRYISTEGVVKTSFLSDTAIAEANAENLTKKITSELERHDLNVKKMTGFTSDGAAVFLGKKNGVGKRLKDINPQIITTHCSDHRLALACRDSYASVPLMKKLDETLDHLHKYYKYSAKHAASLKEVQKAFDEAPLSIQQAKHHRWLSHEKAVSSIVRSYKSLIADLESSSISKDPVGNGLLKNLQDTTNVRLLLLLADVLPHVTGLSLFFQRRSVHLGMVRPMVEKTLQILDNRKTNDGPWLQKAGKLMTDSGIDADQPSLAFTKARCSFLDTLRDNIKDRFVDSDIIDSLSVLDLTDQEEIPSFYGDMEMEAVAQHFSMEPETLACQWQGFLELIKLSSVPKSMDYFLELFYGEKHAAKGILDQFPLVAKAVSAASVLPVSTAEVERVFSQLKLMKTDHRCSLKTSRVDQLLNIKLNCDDTLFAKVAPAVIRDFFGMKNRRLVQLCK